MTEQELQTRLLIYLNSQSKSEFFKVIAANKAGYPDIIGCYHGNFVAVEVKSSKGKLSKLQVFAQYKLDKAGAKIFTVTPDNFEKFKIKLILLKKKQG